MAARAKLLILIALFGLAGCSFEIPDFVGREGGGDSFYDIRGEPAPDPVPVPLRTARVERAVHGVILRVESIAPSQGYYSATLFTRGSRSPEGIITLDLAAVPPSPPEAVGPERTRILTAAVFVPNRQLKGLNGFRVVGSNGEQRVPVP